MTENKPDWQQRVIDEHEALAEKIGKLAAFLEGPVYPSLSAHERQLLDHQLVMMRNYDSCLVSRISLFPKPEEPEEKPDDAG